MKMLSAGLLLALVLIPNAASTQTAEPKYKGFSLTPYHLKRAGYESLPVRVIGAGGGKLSPYDKFKIFASRLKNETSKNVVGVRLSYFVFKSDKLDEALEIGQTNLIALDLPPFEQRKVDLHVVNVEDISLLASKPPGAFRMEIAVTEVVYQDGSIWQGKELPQKMNVDAHPAGSSE